MRRLSFDKGEVQVIVFKAKPSPALRRGMGNLKNKPSLWPHVRSSVKLEAKPSLDTEVAHYSSGWFFISSHHYRCINHRLKVEEAAALNLLQRQAVTTMESKNGVNKEGIILSIQPKKLKKVKYYAKKPVKLISQINMGAARKIRRRRQGELISVEGKP